MGEVKMGEENEEDEYLPIRGMMVRKASFGEEETFLYNYFSMYFKVVFYSFTKQVPLN